MKNKKMIAIINVVKELIVNQARITYANTKYLYVNITLEFLEEYKESYNEKEQLKLKNIEISKTNLDLIKKRQIFEIEIPKAINNTNFIKFATLYEPKYVPYYQDKFLIKNKEVLKILNHPNIWINNPNDENCFDKITKFDNNNLIFLREFADSNSFINDLSKYLGEKLYYDIYDVDGFLSILTNDKNFDFYFDLGDLSNSFIPRNLNPFGILITHYHSDHYNVLLNNNFNARYYILPYGGSVLYNGNQLYPADEIRILSQFNNRAHLLLKGQTYQRSGRNILIPLQIHNVLTLYFPLSPSPRNRNVESICINFNNKVYYPGDSMFYMFKNYINGINNLVASHHGGDVGAINLKNSISNVIINTCRKNYGSTVYNNNIIVYRNNGRIVNVINNYNGLRSLRIII